MNRRQAARIRKLIEKETLENFFRCLFQRVYNSEEIAYVEDPLPRILAKYGNNEWSIKLMPNCLSNIDRDHTHSPDYLLTLAKLFIKIRDYRLACELIFCSALLALQEFITNHQLNVPLNSCWAKHRFVRALSNNIGGRFSVFLQCHMSFFTNSHDADDLKDELEKAIEFIKILRDFQITDELKEKLEEINFNE